MYENLNKPITFRGMTVKNRIFVPPMKTNYIKPDHSMSEEIIQYYEEMARGGVGLVTTEAAEVDGQHLYDPTILGIYEDSQIEGFRKLADALHKYGTKLSVQLIQGGPFANSGWNEGRIPLSCTPIAHVWNPMETPIEMTKEQIESYYGLYAAAALRAKTAGCDAVEIHCAHGHALLGSFLTPVVNHRADEFGGDLKSRAKFLLEVCRAIRAAVGEDFPVSVRLSACDLEEGGNTPEDIGFVCRWLQEVGIDYVHFTNGTLYDVGSLLPPTGKPRALNIPCTDIIRRHCSLPFGVVGRMKEPWVIDQLIGDGQMDIAYVGRQMICDPAFVNKCNEDRFEDVRPCIGCLHCLYTSGLGITMQCTMNPEIADYHLKEIGKADTKKHVVVVGGGPSGMEAAMTAARRGHKVTLLEKASHLGGQFILASYPPVKQELSQGLKWMVHETYKQQVDVRLNTAADLEAVKALDPDEIIVATGAACMMPKWITESGHPNVVAAWDILAGKVHPGMNVVVIGGGSVGCEVAEFMSAKHDYRALGGRKISIIEMLDNLDTGDGTANRDYLMARIAAKPIDAYTGAKVTKITEDSVTYEKGGTETTIPGVDTIVVAMGSVPVNALAEELKALGKPIHAIGDAVKIGKVVDAVAAGRKTAISI